MKRAVLLPAAIAVVVVVHSCDGSKPQPNRPPQPVGSIPAQDVTATDTVKVDVSAYFDDPDGDQLTYNAISYDREVAGVWVTGSILAIEGGKRGKTVVLVNAVDPDGGKASQTFEVTVNGKPGFLRAELSYDEENIGAVLLRIQGLLQDSVEAGTGLEVYHAPVSGGVRAFVAGNIADGGTVLRFWALDSTAPEGYRGTLEEAAGKDYRQRPVGSGRVVIGR